MLQENKSDKQYISGYISAYSSSSHVQNTVTKLPQSQEDWEVYMKKREETLRRKREAEKRRQQRIKQNAEWLALEKYKKHLRYLKYKERTLSLKY